MNTAALASRFRNANKCLFIFGIGVAVLLAFLVRRAWHEDRWSDWGFGDAQTLLTLRHWQEDGWLKCRLLFTPQGYAKIVQLFDSPDLQHHAHGITPGGSPKVGARIRYTHYPAGYLIPFAVAHESGLESPRLLRMIALTFSIAALLLMYWLFCLLSRPVVALLGVGFYALTPAFLGYCDSLANQPLDDALRFFFMAAVVQFTRSATRESRRRWLGCAWMAAALISLSSFDYVLFAFLWLVGWTLLQTRAIQWRLILAFAVAPLLMHTLQFFQNVSYLGFEGAIHDLVTAFQSKSVGGDGASGLYGLSQLRATTHYLGLHAAVVAALYVLYACAVRWLPTPLQPWRLPSPSVLGLLFCCGMAYPLMLPGGMWMPYQGRQLGPFVALLIASILVLSWELLMFLRRENHLRSNLTRIAFASVAVNSATLAVAGYLFFHAERQPAHRFTAALPDVRAAKSLQTISPRHEPVFLSLDGFVFFLTPEYVAGFPQAHPILEYHAGRCPILCFRRGEMLARDLQVMAQRASSRFSPILITHNHAQMTDALNALQDRGLVKMPTPPPARIEGKLVLDLTDLIAWDEIAARSKQP